jgi:hypothetical protein
VADFTPGVGDAMTAKDAYDAAQEGDYGTAALLSALAAVGLVPGVGDAASTAGKAAIKKGMPNEIPGNWYHGTNSPYDFNEIRTPAFVTQDPEFANKFALREFDWGERASFPRHVLDGMTTTGEKAQKGELLSRLQRMHERSPIEASYQAAIQSPNGRVIPVRVRAENAFDYDNPEHVALLSARLPHIGADSFADILNRANKNSSSNWGTIEKHLRTIRGLGFDGVFVKEQNRKNLALFSPTQVKSKLSAPQEPDITNPDMTKAEGGLVEIDDRDPAKRRRLL